MLDGYDDRRYFSINYGWGGYMNAYYTMTPVEGHEADLTELEGRFGKYVRFVVEDMISGKEERWETQ